KAKQKGAVKKCGFISSQPLFTLLSFGSGFKVRGSRGGVAAFFYRMVLSYRSLTHKGKVPERGG
ncbi:MAG: hypothetical protein MSA14_01805, partial [Dialister sp.]|nr:hypothetical protein [Dialister sp.]